MVARADTHPSLAVAPTPAPTSGPIAPGPVAAAAAPAVSAIRPVDDRASAGRTDTSVPISLTARDFARLTQSLFNTIGAAAMTAMTVAAGLSVTVMLTGLALGLVSEAPGVSSLVHVSIFLCLFFAGLAAVGATLFVGLVHLLPRALQFLFLTVRAPWFVPSALVCSPAAGLWRLGLWWEEPWEAGLTGLGLVPQWSYRARKYRGRVDGRSVEVTQHVFGGALEFRFRVADDLPAAYIGPQKIAGTVGILLPLVRCPALTDAELLLRDGQLVVRRRWVRPNLAQLTALVSRMETLSVDLVTELHTLSLLAAQWRQLRAPGEDRWRSPWFTTPAIARYLDALKHSIRGCPPPLATLERVVTDAAIHHQAKAWLLSVIIHRLTAEEARALALAGPDGEPDPIVALGHAPNWPAWVGVHLLVLEGGPEALNALQGLVGAASTPGPLVRAGRRAILKIIQRQGGIHTLTGHLSVVSDDSGQLALAEQGQLSEAPPR